MSRSEKESEPRSCGRGGDEGTGEAAPGWAKALTAIEHTVPRSMPTCCTSPDSLHHNAPLQRQPAMSGALHQPGALR